MYKKRFIPLLTLEERLGEVNDKPYPFYRDLLRDSKIDVSLDGLNVHYHSLAILSYTCNAFLIISYRVSTYGWSGKA